MNDSARAKLFMLAAHASAVVAGLVAGAWLFDQWS